MSNAPILALCRSGHAQPETAVVEVRPFDSAVKGVARSSISLCRPSALRFRSKIRPIAVSSTRVLRSTCPEFDSIRASGHKRIMLYRFMHTVNLECIGRTIR